MKNFEIRKNQNNEIEMKYEVYCNGSFVMWFRLKNDAIRFVEFVKKELKEGE